MLSKTVSVLLNQASTIKKVIQNAQAHHTGRMSVIRRVT